MMNAKPFMKEALDAGHQALESYLWQEARICFETVLNQEETPEAWEGLSLATTWLEDGTTTIEARERAYQLYREQGDVISAARIAIFLSDAYADFRGEFAIAEGWLQRAHHLLKEFEPTVEHGWLSFMDGYIALFFYHDTEAALQLTEETLVLSYSLGQIDLEMVGLSQKGLAMVREGQVKEGMGLLNEAATAAIAGELKDPNAIWIVCCYLINACEQIRDFDRAVHWCAKVEEFCQRYHIRPLFAICRAHYASVLIWQGAWTEAEQVLVSINAELKARPGRMAEAVVRLAELRRRQGQYKEAAALLEQVAYDPFAQLGLAKLSLDQDDPATAVDLAERFLRRIPLKNRIERSLGLEVLVLAQSALGNQAIAIHTLTELQTVVEFFPIKSLFASVSFVEGAVAASGGDYDMACRLFEDAVDIFQQSGAPYETSQARLELAKVLAKLERSHAAHKEVHTALHSLQKIGAHHQANWAKAFLHELKGSKTKGISNPTRLTPRELEVLGLITQGLSNSKIAAQLFLSQHTVHRHVANILTKLDLPTRTAAAAFATRHHLI